MLVGECCTWKYTLIFIRIMRHTYVEFVSEIQSAPVLHQVVHLVTTRVKYHGVAYSCNRRWCGQVKEVMGARLVLI
jgi:hypothetical protein